MIIKIEKDVLVIGTGGAGVRAAIEAAVHGVSVVAVSKAPAGVNNATAMVGMPRMTAGFRAALGGLTPEEHLVDTISIGKRINDCSLVKVLAKEGGERVLELERFGVEMKVRHGSATVYGCPNSKVSRLMTPLVEYAKSQGVRFVENVIVTKLLKEGCTVRGAIGYDFEHGHPILFSTKAVVLATGGSGGIYKRTDCPIRAIGDGYSLAYQAGARLRDMEFVQFSPVILAEPNAPPFYVGGLLTEEGRIINRLGEDIPQKHNVSLRPLMGKSRDLLSRAVMIEILEDRGIDGAVLMDATEVFRRRGDDELFTRHPYAFLKDRVKANKRPFRVAPVCHFTMGGVITDENCNTCVPGLFAAGEVVGGLHGANRHGGNALTAITVFGARAGATAAEYAKTQIHISMESSAEIELNLYRDMKSGKSSSPKATKEIMQILRNIMWEKAGIIRCGHALTEALMEINELRSRKIGLGVSSRRKMMEALEVPMALDAAEMTCRAALKREESRGAHYRTDFPDEDENWLKVIVLKRGSEGDMKLALKSI